MKSGVMGELKAMRLHGMAGAWADLIEQGGNAGIETSRWLIEHLLQAEAVDRAMRSVSHQMHAAKFPVHRDLAGFDFEVSPVDRKLVSTAFTEEAHNVVLVGGPGVGKSHVGCGIGHALIDAGYRMLYMRTSELVQRLQAARQSLQLPQALAKLDRYDLLILDDISYVRKDQAETSVLFELIAERYERRSILITANQPFSGWNNVFPDPGMTVAAIDRLVHHSTIFELSNVESYRSKEAARQQMVQRENDKTSRRRQSPNDNDKQTKEPNP